MARIGIDASRTNTAHPTGTEWYSYELLRALALRAHGDEFFLYSKKRLSKGLRDLGPHVHERVLAWPPKRLWTHTRLSWEMLRRPPEVLFVPAHTIPIIHPPNTVTTTHDIGFDRFPELYSRSELYYHRWSMRYAVRHARHIITPSAFTRQEILDVYHVDPRRLTVVYHGFDPQRFRPLENDVKRIQLLRKYKLEQPYILSIGRLEQKKNTLGLVQAFKIILQKKRRPLTLVLAGNPGYRFDAIRAYIAENHLQDHIRFTGYAEADDLPILLNTAAVFAFPSFYEGFGFPILEAQACGVPVVTSTAASMPEIAGSSAVLVDPHRPDEIAEGILRVLEDEAYASSLREAGRKNLLRFTWEKCAEQTLGVLHRITDTVA